MISATEKHHWRNSWPQQRTKNVLEAQSARYGAVTSSEACVSPSGFSVRSALETGGYHHRQRMYQPFGLARKFPSALRGSCLRFWQKLPSVLIDYRFRACASNFFVLALESLLLWVMPGDLKPAGLAHPLPGPQAPARVMKEQQRPGRPTQPCLRARSRVQKPERIVVASLALLSQALMNRKWRKELEKH
ncbi:hypothetical protein Poly51_35900 [Rubripirellula tenax]|uniref:Uncharacterized protein n=1 Tax=Rubripirellula tenax TaxID=2528015 RepID=A0A5C6F0F5_9BACT|nr:hypothetical protein Poly51_35900 [Rubripirellula tenax]